MALLTYKDLNKQKYPASIIKKAAVLYCYSSWTYEPEDCGKRGKSGIDLQEWIVRSVQKRKGSQTVYGRKQLGRTDDTTYVNVTQKISGITWGKLSTKQFHRGFFASISKHHKKQFRVGDELPHGLFTTKLAAIRYAIKLQKFTMQSTQVSIDKGNKWQAEHEGDMIDEKNELRLLEMRLKKLKKDSK
ncbi:hypothetical protein COPG_00109 [Colwellia phage 9A]|uniref:Uncharacterized protein n=1 Tax=Colwellia phage 9A TaxID=765765 RepID=I3UMJ0_9CAUD|nr:hypothetical protein COPG_00109 [Colwellia phage 9A]AFK66705.1 hypothetical protein COPG_00109 [Colwellia phage 9A]